MDDRLDGRGLSKTRGQGMNAEQDERDKPVSDLKFYGVYRGEDGAQNAIIELKQQGYGPDDIYVYTKNEEKANQIGESAQRGTNLSSCYFESEYIMESYDEGNIVICVRDLLKKSIDRTQEGSAVAEAQPETAADVHARMMEEQREQKE